MNQAIPFRIEQQPMLTAGMLAADDRGIVLLIDNEQNDRERAVTCWHETLHLLLAGTGCATHDEVVIEAAAKRLADVCPNVLAGDLAGPAPVPPQSLPFDDEVRHILGYLCFQVIGIAAALRALGHEIPNKAEAEQAAAIHWMLNLYLEHGANWRRVGSVQLAAGAALMKQEQSK